MGARAEWSLPPWVCKSTDINRYRSCFMEYKLTRVNSIPRGRLYKLTRVNSVWRGRLWWILYISINYALQIPQSFNKPSIFWDINSHIGQSRSGLVLQCRVHTVYLWYIYNISTLDFCREMFRGCNEWRLLGVVIRESRGNWGQSIKGRAQHRVSWEAALGSGKIQF